MKIGIKWVFYPTTLLSQCDSCIGGKTALNFKKYKNQLALFSSPDKVVIDTNFLSTLSPQDITSGYGEIVKLFLESGADINFADMFGETALMKASTAGFVDCSLLLLENGADINIVDGLGETALSRASKEGHAKIVRLFLERGADINIVDGRGETALSRASEKADL